MRVSICKMLIVLSAAIMVLVWVGCSGTATVSASKNPVETFTDSRDGKSYNMVRIGNLTWMAENLKYEAANSWCYGNNASNCAKYGKLYSWDAAVTACPAGWRLPAREDWNDLALAAGGRAFVGASGQALAGGHTYAGTKLKSGSPNWNGTNKIGFSALPGGFRNTDGSFSSVGSSGFWWSATDGGGGLAWVRVMFSKNDMVGEGNVRKGYGYSARCVAETEKPVKPEKPVETEKLVATEKTAETFTGSNQNWTGTGGKEISITILAPQATGLAENQSYIPALVQGEFVNNFSTYSAISVLDWEQRDALLVRLISGSYSDSVSAEAAREIGNAVPTTHFMQGNIAKTSTGYNLQMNVIKTADKTTAASFSKSFTFAELDNLTGIRQASLELLQKMGVALTAEAQKELAGAAQTNYVTAQTALALGVTAQRQGTEVAALSYYFQAAVFDPSMMEAVNRSSILKANITSGNIGDNVRNDIVWRKQWVDRLTETERFFDNLNRAKSVPYTLFYVSDIKQGKINYQNETVTMSIETYLRRNSMWDLSIERALQAIWDGLNATGRKDAWQLDRWPTRTVTNSNAFFGRNEFSVVFELLDNQNKVISRQTLQAEGSWGLSHGGRPRVGISSTGMNYMSYVLSMSNRGIKTLHFQDVNANDITDNLTIRVVSVNGKDAKTAAIEGVLQIRAISESEVVMNNKFEFAKGEILGFDPHLRVTELVIPSTIWGEPVVSIRQEAFRHVSFGKVTIPNSVTSIGDRAFQAGGTFVVLPNEARIYRLGQLD